NFFPRPSGGLLDATSGELFSGPGYVTVTRIYKPQRRASPPALKTPVCYGVACAKYQQIAGPHEPESSLQQFVDIEAYHGLVYLFMGLLGPVGEDDPFPGDDPAPLDPAVVGAAREYKVAELTGGKVQGMAGRQGLKVVEPNVG